MPRGLSPRWLGLSSSEPRCRTCTRSAETAEVHAPLVPLEGLLARLAKNVQPFPREGALRQTILLVLMLALSALYPSQTDPPVREVRQKLGSSSVSTRHASLDGWMEISLSREPIRGAPFGAADGGRAEFQLGSKLPRVDSIDAYRLLTADRHPLPVRLLPGQTRRPRPQALAPEPPTGKKPAMTATFTSVAATNGAASREESRPSSSP